jgi:hypothetical protein
MRLLPAKKWPHQPTNRHLYPSGKMPGSFEAAPHTGTLYWRQLLSTHSHVLLAEILQIICWQERLNYQLQLLSLLFA